MRFFYEQRAESYWTDDQSDDWGVCVADRDSQGKPPIRCSLRI